MNNLKFGVLACGLIGLISVFLPQIKLGEMSISLWDAHKEDAANVYMIMGCFGVALAMGAMGVAKAPMQRWQSILALIGFAIVCLKMRAGLPTKFMHGAIGMKLMGLTAMIGAVISAVTIAKPETAK